MIFTIAKKHGGTLSKTIGYQGGKITKDANECWLSKGTATRKDMTLEEFSGMLRTVGKDQALVHGVSGPAKVNIVSVKNYNGQPNTITRTKDYFSFVDGEGSAFFDHDPKPGQPIYSQDKFITTMAAAFPAIGDMGTVWTPSTSACIYKDGKQVVGEEGGFHLYFAVKDATDLPRFAGVLFKRCWLAGHGYIFVTQDGKQLERTIFDNAVFSPERLDFVAGAVCKDGLEQRLPEPVYTPGDVLDTSMLHVLTDDEESQYKELVEAAKRENNGKAAEIRGDYIRVEVKRLVKTGVQQAEARRIVEKRIGGDLYGADVLYFDQAGEATVDQVLSDPGKYDRETLRDPLEPEQGPCKAMFYANVKDSKPVVHSQAHGGRDFFLHATDGWSEPEPLPEGERMEHSEYPMELLPDSVREAAAEVARFAKVPGVSPAVVGLSMVAAGIGKKAVVAERQGLEHHPATFHVLIAASGERKTPAFSLMAYPFDQWAKKELEQYEEQKRTVAANNIAIDSAISGLKSQAKKSGADLDATEREIVTLSMKRKRLPPYPSLYTTDTSEQRLFQKMHDRGGAYAVMTSEGRPAIDAILGKYSGDGKTGEGIYLAGISGDTITRDRVGGDKGPEERVIYNPCLNVCIMVQPDKYMEAARCTALRESGALARIWPVWLLSLVGSRLEGKDEQGLSRKKMASYNRMITDLLSAEPPVDENGEHCHKACLSPEASEARRVYHNTIEKMMVDGGEFEDVRDIASKAVTQTVKLALVLHMADYPQLLEQASSTIDFGTWARAQTLGTYHLQEAVRSQRMAGEDATFTAARRVLDWIKREGLQEFTARDLCRKGPRPRPRAAQAREILEPLLDAGYLRENKQAGKRKPVYAVNPLAVVAKVANVAGG